MKSVLKSVAKFLVFLLIFILLAVVFLWISGRNLPFLNINNSKIKNVVVENYIDDSPEDKDVGIYEFKARNFSENKIKAKLLNLSVDKFSYMLYTDKIERTAKISPQTRFTCRDRYSVIGGRTYDNSNSDMDFEGIDPINFKKFLDVNSANTEKIVYAIQGESELPSFFSFQAEEGADKNEVDIVLFYAKDCSKLK